MKYLFRIKNRLLVIIILLLGVNYNLKAQTNLGVIQETKMEIQSEGKDGKPFEAYTNLCYMFLNMNNGDFMFKTDINTFESGDTYLDSILNNNGSQPITFKSNISDNLSRFSNDGDIKMYDTKGVLTINGIDIPCVAQFDPMTFGDKNDQKNYRLDFRLSVDANKINIKGFENKLSKQVLLQIARGTINVTN